MPTCNIFSWLAQCSGDMDRDASLWFLILTSSYLAYNCHILKMLTIHGLANIKSIRFTIYK